jgi:hypothetical protein
MSRAACRPLLACLLLVATLAGCAAPSPPAPRYSDIVFGGEPIKLSVGAIEVVEAYTPTLAAPFVEHRFPVSPLRMAARWARDRLVAAGGPLRARYTVKQASVRETELPRTDGIRGAFTRDQAQRYEAVIDVELAIVDERGFATGQVSAHVERRQTVAEDLTLTQRDEIWYQMTQNLAEALNAELDKNIRANLPRFIVY